MAIDKNKPLPDHTKLDYDECCAKLILEELFPNRYPKLMLADKPDLQGKDVGIEVTLAANRDHMEALKLWYTMPYINESSKKRNIERMEQLGVKYTPGIQAWPGGTPTIDQTVCAVESKIKKLKNLTYKVFPRYELFVFTDTWYHESVVEKAKEYLFDDKVSKYYKTVYVLSEGCNLHIFETEDKAYSCIEIPVPEQSDRNNRARQMVEEAEGSR